MRRPGLSLVAAGTLAMLTGCGGSAPYVSVLPRGSVPWAALDARCRLRVRPPEPYPWPLRPFNRQHPVRGFFGDPRTQLESSNSTRPGTPGSFSFHNGVDIVGRPGQSVYPVVSGTVHRLSGDELVVETSDRRRFQYFHLNGRVQSGAHVVAEQTRLGTIRAAWGHIHLSEIRRGCVVNPLAPGHLEPYADRNRPRLLAIEALDNGGRRLDPRHLAGSFELVARAVDVPPLSVPGVWRDLPVTPAFVSWQLTASGRMLVPPTVVADFRLTIPPDRDFWVVYGPGSHENFVERHRGALQRTPGLYLFRLTHTPAVLPRGRYQVSVTVADTAGNSDTAREKLTVTSSGRAPLVAAPRSPGRR